MKRYIVGFFLFFLTGFCIAQDDPELKNLAWHRYVTTNFTILSLNDDQGNWMKNNLENIKSWCLTRWGFPDIKFSKECRVFCVPDNAMLSKLFNLTSSKVEIRRNNGSIEITAMWISLDDKPARIIPTNLSSIILSELEQVNKLKFPLWATIGISKLNGTQEDIRYSLSFLSDKSLFSIDDLLSLTNDQYSKFDNEKQQLFDSQSVALCLFLRKEFGEVKLHSFLKINYQSGYSVAVKIVLGFLSISEFEKTYIRYVKGLSKDVSDKITPDSYLTIKQLEN